MATITQAEQQQTTQNIQQITREAQKKPIPIRGKIPQPTLMGSNLFLFLGIREV
jgi:hypothetical protein